MPDLEIYTLSDYLKIVENRPLVINLHGSTTGALFRGHSSERYKLIPSIYRYMGLGHYEREMVREFIMNSDHLIRKKPNNYMDWLFLMQHYGLPTRLLDWTESALVALFFSVEDTSMHGENGCVWMLDPWTLNHDFDKDFMRLPSSDSEFVNDHTIQVNDPSVPRAPKSAKPIAIRTERNSIRSVNQKAMVTVHGNKDIPLDEVKSPTGAEFIAKICVPAQFKPKILDELFRLGVTHQMIYPSLDSLSKDIIYKYKILASV